MISDANYFIGCFHTVFWHIYFVISSTDTVDLSVAYYKLVNNTVHTNTFVSLDLNMKVFLYGSTTLNPATKPYSVYAYLSVDDQLETDIDLRVSLMRFIVQLLKIC